MAGRRPPPGKESGGRACTRPQRSLKARAIAYLARREYGRAELRERLLHTVGTEPPAPEELDKLLDELTALGYLSDARFAQAMVARRAATHSRRAIAETLKARGVPAEQVAQALVAAPADDTAAMQGVWQRRFGRVPQDAREKARQVRFLQSRGFALSAILKLLRDPPVRDVDSDDSGGTR